MKITPSGRKHFTKEEKLRIINECQDKGVKITCEKYGIYPASYYYWKKSIVEKGEQGLNQEWSKASRAEIKQLKKELDQYKMMLAEEKLKSRMKDELLKKKYPNQRK